MGTNARKSSDGTRTVTVTRHGRHCHSTWHKRLGAAALALSIAGSVGACAVPAAAPPVLATASASSTSPAAAPSAECMAWQFLDKTNALRTQRGMTSLIMLTTASSTARSHSQAMASSGTLRHSNLSASANHGFGGGNWAGAAENVGKGPTVASVHSALVASPSHYAAMMNPSYDGVGIGVVQSGRVVWVTELFADLRSMPTKAVRPRC